jgi:hypothetical protein
MGRLHDRMAEDLRLRNFSPTTQRNYLFYARRFAAFFMRSPEELSEAEIRQFLLHQIEVKHLSYPGAWIDQPSLVGLCLSAASQHLVVQE